MNNPDARLAIVVPAYNEEASIEATLAALYDQSNVETAEHIIVDNGSTDRTQAVVQRFAKNHEGFPLRIVE